MLAERFRESGATAAAKQNSIVVLPFINFGNSVVVDAEKAPAPLYGYALADAIAARLARMTSLVVRPSSSLMTIPAQQLDPLSIGKKLLVRFVLAGNFMRSDAGFDLNWQLLDIPSQSVRAGGSINVASFDLISVQTEICNEVFSTLQGFGDLENTAPSAEGTRDTRAFAEPGLVGGVSAGARGTVVLHVAHRLAGRPEPRPRSLRKRAQAGRELRARLVRPGHHPPAIRAPRPGRPDARHGSPPRLRQGPPARSRLGRGQPLPRLHAALPRREGIRPPRHRTPADHRRQRLERPPGRRPHPAHRRPVRRSAGPVQHLAAPQPGQRRHHLQPPRPRLPVSKPARTRRRRD